MTLTLYNYVETFLAALPEAVTWLRVQTSGGFQEIAEKLLGHAIAHLESSGNYLRSSGENAITCAAIGFLNRYGIEATSQTNSRGHVDILMKNSLRPGFTICGEAKIWRGVAYHIGGLNQVLGYTVGRYPFCFVLAYVQTGAIKDHIETLQATLDASHPEAQQGPCSRHGTLTWALLSNHQHNSGESVRVLHAGVNLA
jgi:hypothetical protein